MEGQYIPSSPLKSLSQYIQNKAKKATIDDNGLRTPTIKQFPYKKRRVMRFLFSLVFRRVSESSYDGLFGMPIIFPGEQGQAFLCTVAASNFGIFRFSRSFPKTMNTNHSNFYSLSLETMFKTYNTTQGVNILDLALTESIFGDSENGLNMYQHLWTGGITHQQGTNTLGGNVEKRTWRASAFNERLTCIGKPLVININWLCQIKNRTMISSKKQQAIKNMNWSLRALRVQEQVTFRHHILSFAYEINMEVPHRIHNNIEAKNAGERSIIIRIFFDGYA